MTNQELANQWSDNTLQGFSDLGDGFETFMLYLFTTSAGWIILAALALWIGYGILATAPPRRTVPPPPPPPPVSNYRSPAGYRNGVKLDD